MRNVKYIGNDTTQHEYGKVHYNEGHKTGCGAIISDNPEDWIETDDPITCDKDGCKNHRN